MMIDCRRANTIRAIPDPAPAGTPWQATRSRPEAAWRNRLKAPLLASAPFTPYDSTLDAPRGASFVVSPAPPAPANLSSPRGGPLILPPGPRRANRLTRRLTGRPTSCHKTRRR